MSRTAIKVIFSELVRFVTFPIRLLPIKSNRILFTGLTGGNGYDYSCNPKYIFEYMKNCEGNAYEYVWAVKDPAQYAFLQEEGVKVVKHFTLSSIPMLLTSKVIITNGSYVPWFPFRKKQYVINTWHGGGAYKKVEMETGKEDWATRHMVTFCANNMRLFAASCKVQEEQMIRQTYQYKGEVLRAGTPRNDCLVRKQTQPMNEKVRQHYRIPMDARIILYAPTYRYGNVPVHLNCDSLLQRLEANGESWVFLNRYHRYQTADMNVRVDGSRMIDVMDYPDMQELLAAADVLITDYSSSVWDYGFLQRPCILYVPDKEEYMEQTGFYVELDEWPFPQAVTEDQVADKILQLMQNVDNYSDYVGQIARHYEQLGSYETGHAAETICERIREVTHGTEKQ